MRQEPEGRRPRFRIKGRANRPFQVVAEDHYSTIATYTLDAAYVTPVQTEDLDYYKVLPVGTVLDYHPSTGNVVPHHTSYNFGVIGVLVGGDANCGIVGGAEVGNRTVGVLFRGVVFEDRSWDGGTYGTVTQAVKDALARRIDFVKSTSPHKLKAFTQGGIWNVK